MPQVLVSTNWICIILLLLTIFTFREKYKNPRVLSCLHVLCENCLKESLTADDEDCCENTLFTGRGKHLTVITCPLCKQDTMVGSYIFYDSCLIMFIKN